MKKDGDSPRHSPGALLGRARRAGLQNQRPSNSPYSSQGCEKQLRRHHKTRH